MTKKEEVDTYEVSTSLNLALHIGNAVSCYRMEANGFVVYQRWLFFHKCFKKPL